MSPRRSATLPRDARLHDRGHAAHFQSSPHRTGVRSAAMGDPSRVCFDHAPDAIRARVAHGRTAVVGLTGPVGSGKSTLAALLSPCILATDDYLPDYDRLPEHERDEPHHADLPRLAENIRALREGRPARVPVWSFHAHARTGERDVAPPAAPGLIVVEGLHALHTSLLPLLDLAVYVDAPRGVRWERWEYLETSGVRGWGPDRARAFFDAVAEPTFARYEPGYRAAASLIVLNDAGVPRRDTFPA